MAGRESNAESFTRRAKAVLGRVGAFASASWAVFRFAVKRFAELRAGEAAAGMAFYALFSLFPMLLCLVAVGSRVLEAEEARREVIDLATRFLPISQELVIQNLRQVLRSRGAIGAIATISLLWSASGFLMILGRQINRVWPAAPSRTVAQGRLMALVMASGLAGLLMIWLSLTTVLTFLLRFNLPLKGALLGYGPVVRAIVYQLIPWVLPFSCFAFLYRFIPNTSVGWIEAFSRALVATLAWKASTAGFIWYLASGFPRYHLVYGSLGSVVVLMFWIYLTNSITLFGAHLSAAISPRTGRAGSIEKR